MSKFFLLLFFIATFTQAQTTIPVSEATPAAISDERLSDIPVAQDDLDSEVILRYMIRKAHWLGSVKIDVDHGIVYITGEYQNKTHMQWLIDTAEKLPTILAVVNNAKFVEPPVTDLAPYVSEWNGLVKSFKKTMPKILIGVSLLLIFWLIGHYLQKGFHKIWKTRIKNPFLLSTITKVVFIPVWAFFFYLIMQILGLQRLATTIIGGTGIASIVFGLAFRGIAENFLSGILLAMRSPFTQGDHIKVNDFQGIVQNLNMRGTTIVDLDGNLILIPNTTIIQSVVQNYSANPQKRANFVIDVGLSESHRELESIILKVLREMKGVKDDPKPLVIVEKLEAFKIMKTKTFFWYDSACFSEDNLKSLAITKIKDSFIAEGILVPEGGNPEEIRERARRYLSQGVEEEDGTRHEEELQKVAINSSLPVNTQNLLKQ